MAPKRDLPTRNAQHAGQVPSEPWAAEKIGWESASRLGVIPVTAMPTQSPHTRIMQRVVDEAEYVLAVLCQMRDKVSEDPELYDPDAQERMDEAITHVQHVLRSARSQLKNWTVEPNVKAA